MTKPLVLSADCLQKSFKSRKVVKSVSFDVKEREVVGFLDLMEQVRQPAFYMVVGFFIQMMVLFTSAERISRSFQCTLELVKESVIYLRICLYLEDLASKITLKLLWKLLVFQNMSKKTFLDELLTKFQITHIAKSFGAALSGGERRRVEIARSLIIKPKFLLLDEPFAGIDPVTVQEIQKIIEKLRDEEGLGVLITDHNVRETLGACDRAYILTAGEIVAHGVPEEIATNEKVKQVYLGDNFTLN